MENTITMPFSEYVTMLKFIEQIKNERFEKFELEKYIKANDSIYYFDQIKFDEKIKNEYLDTLKQYADVKNYAFKLIDAILKTNIFTLNELKGIAHHVNRKMLLY